MNFLRKLKSKLFGIPTLKTGTGIWTAPETRSYEFSGGPAVGLGSAGSPVAVAVPAKLYDVPTRRADEPVGGKNAEGVERR